MPMEAAGIRTVGRYQCTVRLRATDSGLVPNPFHAYESKAREPISSRHGSTVGDNWGKRDALPVHLTSGTPSRGREAVIWLNATRPFDREPIIPATASRQEDPHLIEDVKSFP